ncbi:MAG: DUF6265 family protein [Parvularculaceae bacterium]
MKIQKIGALTAPFILGVAALFPLTAHAQIQHSLSDLAFLEGHWRGENGLVFEETWSTAEGGVMTAMARGVSEGKLAVLEYVIVSEEDGALVMRFKHYGADYSAWEGDGEPVTLTLTAAAPRDVTFSADPPSQHVKSVRYFMPDKKTMQADIDLVEEDGPRSFSLVFKRVRD